MTENHPKISFIDPQLAEEVAAGQDTFLEFLDVAVGANGIHQGAAWLGLEAELSESLISFANTNGGTVVLGVDRRARRTIYPGPMWILPFTITMSPMVTPGTRNASRGRGEGFLTLVRTSVELSGRRPEIVNMGGSVKLTLFAALGEDSGNVIEAEYKSRTRR